MRIGFRLPENRAAPLPERLFPLGGHAGGGRHESEPGRDLEKLVMNALKRLNPPVVLGPLPGLVPSIGPRPFRFRPTC